MKKRILAAAMAVALALSIVPSVRAEEFTDVSGDHPHKLAIDYCVANGFFKGKGDGIFDPDDPITREQLAVVWARTFQARIPRFADATQPKDEVDNAIILMYALGYMNGISETLFGHYGQATREQVISITQRTYLRGVDGGETYKQYTDWESIAGWAQNAVGACLSNDLLDGVFSGDALQPQKAITRAEVCQIIFNVMKTEYTITAEETEGGTVTPSKTEAYAGETIVLTVTPEAGMRLVSGSLKVDGTALDGLSFVMPARNVVVTAEFEEEPEPEAEPTLTGILISDMPEQTAYTVGETLDLTGLEVTALYDDDTSAVVEGWTADPAAGSTLDESGTVQISVTYSEGGENAGTSFDITVSEEP